MLSARARPALTWLALALASMLLVIGCAALLVERRRRRGIRNIANVLEHHRRYWRARARRSGELLYVALGDSTAQGIGASRPDRGYVGLLARRISRITGRRVRVVNLSVSGATSALLIEKQLPRLAKLRPDIVTMTIGANDMPTFDPEAFEHAYRAILEALPDHAIVADVPHFYIIPAERRVRVANRILRALIAERGLAMAPLYDAMRRQGLWAVLTQFKDDYFHPNDAGYRVWASAFHDAIDDRCAQLLDQSLARRPRPVNRLPISRAAVTLEVDERSTAMSMDSTAGADDQVDPLLSETNGVDQSEIPAVDAQAIDGDQPDSQGDDLVEAALGEDGQGDLAPEDTPAGGSDPLTDDGPQDLRTEV